MSNWMVLAKPYDTDASLTDASVFQSVKFSENVILKAVMSWMVVFNDPTFTSLSMKIYSNDEQEASTTPKVLLHTSTNTQMKSSVHTLDHACKELFFEFANINLRRGTWYNFVINAVGYSGASSASHLAWKNTYPDPIYTTGVDESKPLADTYPLTFVPIFDRFEIP